VNKISKIKSAETVQKRRIVKKRGAEQIEFHGRDVLIHEPLASRVREFCRRHKISPRQFFIKAVMVHSEDDKAAQEIKAAKPKENKAQRGKGTREML